MGPDEFEVMDDDDDDNRKWEVIDEDSGQEGVATKSGPPALPQAPPSAPPRGGGSGTPLPTAPPLRHPLAAAAPGATAKPGAGGGAAAGVAAGGEKKVNPEDGRLYTFEQLRDAYIKGFSEEELRVYWRDEMHPPGGDQGRAESILRSMGMLGSASGAGFSGTLGAGLGAGFGNGGEFGRLPGGFGDDPMGGIHNPTPIPVNGPLMSAAAGRGGSNTGSAAAAAGRLRYEAVDGKERRRSPEDGKVYTYEELSGVFWRKCGEDWDAWNEEGVRSFWFEKCVADPEERRCIPDDPSGRTYTLAELREQYRDEYGEDDLRAYWRDACEPTAFDDAAPTAAAAKEGEGADGRLSR